MAYAGHYDVRIEGKFTTPVGDTPERWSTGIHVAAFDQSLGIGVGPYNGGERLVSPDDYLHNQVEPAARILIANNRIQPGVSVTRLTCNYVLPTGLYEDPVTHELLVEDFSGGPIVGTGLQYALFPFQVSQVLTLLSTYRSRGPASHGRMYLPGPAQALDTDGRIHADQAAAFAGIGQQFITALRTSDNGNTPTTLWWPANVSRVGAAVAVIDGVSAGRVYDTQRRRRTSLVEEYQLVAVP